MMCETGLVFSSSMSGGGGGGYTLAIGNPVSGGTSGYMLTVDGSGNLSQQAISSASPAAPDQAIQFNDGGTFGGDANFTWNNTNNILSLNNMYVFTPQAGSICMGMALACGNLSMSGEKNICIGGESASGFGENGVSLTTGDENVFISSGVGRLITTGSRNVFVGSDCAASTGVDVSDNVGIGRGVMRFLATGSTGNVAIGQGNFGGGSPVSGNYNVSIGYQNLGANTADGNVAIGFAALAATTSGFNIGIGDSVGQNITSGSGHVLIGSLAGNDIGPLQNNDTIVGFQAGSLNNLSNCSFFGAYAGYNNTGANNTAVGHGALGSGGIGTPADTSGNTAIGAQSLVAIDTSVVGSNTALGYSSGISLTTGFRSVFLGAGSDTSKVDVAASIALGTGATVTADNQMVIGSPTAAILDLFIGTGVSTASPSDIAIRGTGGSGTDIQGAKLVIAPGVSTGAAASKSVVVTAYSASTTGTTPNAEVNHTEFSSTNLSTIFYGRVQGKKGSDVSSATDITLGNGNVFTITGNTQIDNIVATNWQAGSIVTLIFSSNPTVRHNTAGGGARIFLNGSANLTAATNTVLTLVYDGTQWQEIARKVA